MRLNFHESLGLKLLAVARHEQSKMYIPTVQHVLSAYLIFLYFFLVEAVANDTSLVFGPPTPDALNPLNLSAPVVRLMWTVPPDFLSSHPPSVDIWFITKSSSGDYGLYQLEANHTITAGNNTSDWNPKYVKQTLEDTQWKIKTGETTGFVELHAHMESGADYGPWYFSDEFEIIGYKYLTSAGARLRPTRDVISGLSWALLTMSLMWYEIY